MPIDVRVNQSKKDSELLDPEDEGCRSFETLRIPIDTVSHPGRSETPAIPL